MNIAAQLRQTAKIEYPAGSFWQIDFSHHVVPFYVYNVCSQEKACFEDAFDPDGARGVADAPPSRILGIGSHSSYSCR